MGFFNTHIGAAAATAAGILLLTHHPLLLLSATAHPLTINPALGGITHHSAAAFNHSEPTLPVPANAPPIPVPGTSPPLLLDLAGRRIPAPPEPALGIAVTIALSEALAYISVHPPAQVFPMAEHRFPAKQTIVRFSVGNILEEQDFTFGQAGKCVRVLLDTLSETREWRRGGAWVRRAEGGGEVVTFMQLGNPDRADVEVGEGEGEGVVATA